MFAVAACLAFVMGGPIGIAFGAIAGIIGLVVVITHIIESCKPCTNSQKYQPPKIKGKNTQQVVKENETCKQKSNEKEGKHSGKNNKKSKNSKKDINNNINNKDRLSK